MTTPNWLSTPRAPLILIGAISDKYTGATVVFTPNNNKTSRQIYNRLQKKNVEFLSWVEPMNDYRSVLKSLSLLLIYSYLELNRYYSVLNIKSGVAI